MDINEIVKQEPVFPDAEIWKGKDLVNKTIGIKGYAKLSGQDGDYFVILALYKKELISFSNGSSVVMKKVKKMAEHFNVEPNEDEAYIFPEPVECKLVEVKSNTSGRLYYDLVSANTEEKVK